MSNLYELTAEYKRLCEMDAGDDEGFAEALAETLSADKEMVEDKLEKTLLVARSLESDADACAAEAKRLSERAARLRGNADTCKRRVLEAMADLGMDKVKRPLLSFARVKGKPVVSVSDQASIPPAYIRTKEVVSVDKTAVMKALKAGVEVPGCELGSGNESLRIS